MFEVDVANRICRPTCARFFASLDRELDGADRQDHTTLRLCQALFTRADNIGATYHEVFSSAALAALEVVYGTGHDVQDFLAMLAPKLEELATQPLTDTQVQSPVGPSLFGRAGSENDPRVWTLLRAMFADSTGSPTALDILQASANALLLVVRDAGMSADATVNAVRRLANARYAS